MPNIKQPTLICTMCNLTKPREDFMRRLTLRQTQALLRRPDIRTRTSVISSRCKACWEQTKSTKPLTKKQIRNKMNSGDLHRVKGEMMLKKLEDKLPEMRSQVMKQYWNDKKAKPIKELSSNLQQQVDKYKSRYYSLRNINPQHADLPQYKANYEQARLLKKKLIADAKQSTKTITKTQINLASLLQPRKGNDDV